ncbi:hypothetical protein CHH90_06665 [Bacillus licheniformis]|nr:hypothetical protein [Bacillus sonorensis]OJT56594.1 hypothetical protein BFP47_15665 [Bacillus licheniformis]OJT69259.1 hypothetical protein BFP46_08230 [Bacillus licheniformis]OLO18879.1 hypothetical protein BKP29_0212305 [Bacillus licheniformis]PAE41688.1 hypothetical protein CHH96_02480 [Bacillus licheniformis]
MIRVIKEKQAVVGLLFIDFFSYMGLYPKFTVRSDSLNSKSAISFSSSLVFTNLNLSLNSSIINKQVEIKY